MTGKGEIGKFVGLITQISGEQSLYFLVNNDVKCSIGDIVGCKVNDNHYVLASVAQIKIEFYLDNTNQYFISKAVENSMEKMSETNNKPRYGQYVVAALLGHYEFYDGSLREIKNKINRYTPAVFQKVFIVDFEIALDIYGLGRKTDINENILQNTITLGTATFSGNKHGMEHYIPLHFKTATFKHHSLITGVTGSGKSRLAALIIKQLAKTGAHISILDPHNEYTQLLSGSAKYTIFNYSYSQDYNFANNTNANVKYASINFSESSINGYTLTKLLPALSEQQEAIIYETLNKFTTGNFYLKDFIEQLLEDLSTELRSDYPLLAESIRKVQIASDKAHRTHTEFVSLFVRGLKSIPSFVKANRSNVLLAIISKTNELREHNLIVTNEPNWLTNAPYTIDVFNIDYSTNEYIRRFINGIIQLFLRKTSNDSFRIFVVDEAHLLLNDKTKTSELVKQLLREARKFNITVMFISQNAQDIPEDIRSQFQNHFRFREKGNEITEYFPDQVCMVSLYGAKSSIPMKVETIHTNADNTAIT